MRIRLADRLIECLSMAMLMAVAALVTLAYGL